MPAGRPGHRPRPAPRDCPTPMGCWGPIGGGDLHRQTLREVGGLVEALASSDRSEEVMEQLLQFTGADHPGRAACVCALGRPRFFWLQAPCKNGALFVTGVRRGTQRARVNTKTSSACCVLILPRSRGGGSGHFSPGNQLWDLCADLSRWADGGYGRSPCHRKSQLNRWADCVLNLSCKSRGQIVTELGGWSPPEGSRQGLEGCMGIGGEDRQPLGWAPVARR